MKAARTRGAAPSWIPEITTEIRFPRASGASPSQHSTRVMRNVVGCVLRFGFFYLASKQPGQPAKPATTGAADVVQHDADNICSNRLQPVSRVFGQLAVGLVRP